MIKTVLFDIYGMIINREMRFSKRFSNEFNVPMEKILPFFENEFQLCLVGKADLKEELQKYLSSWNWQGSVDDLLEYWFGHEGDIDPQIMESVRNLRGDGVKCFINTQNDKHLVKYVLENIGLKDFFDGVFCTNEIGYKKPQQEYWQAIYNRLGNPDKETVLCWDDEEKHITAAKEFGFSAELYTRFEAYENKIKSYLIKS
jgi:putative hydrolase of the HAD superfamily